MKHKALIFSTWVSLGTFLLPVCGQAQSIIDLTYPFDRRTIYWPTEQGFRFWYKRFGLTNRGYFYAAGEFCAPEHGGTHMDAPLHFSRSGATADQVPLKACIGPACVVDFSNRSAKNPDATLQVSDIRRYESRYGRIPDGAIVVARSGWGKFWGNRRKYLGSDRPGDITHLHFPGFSVEAVRFLLRERQVAALAIDTASMDPGNALEFPVHRLWLGAGRPGFENLAHAELLPPRGATLYCAPMKIGGGTGAPARIFAVVP
ncbi:cyclase family protein [Candidatus Methylacidithermus pantelleriae]|uniref:Kynurenine formamidase n=1 Tax=Candidatus Methylacidithermus pantelleriae TaxID=2744239 RepID=A0A8J2FTM1_9BACT|nr:cyclase family protein [Candidatus Methylacidithermus pantelleriae]CAF0705348.1 Kynurenine formamidase [Candidatus Methylacidithermus pantelleriae]